MPLRKTGSCFSYTLRNCFHQCYTSVVQLHGLMERCYSYHIRGVFLHLCQHLCRGCYDSKAAMEPFAASVLNHALPVLHVKPSHKISAQSFSTSTQTYPRPCGHECIPNRVLWLLLMPFFSGNQSTRWAKQSSLPVFQADLLCKTIFSSLKRKMLLAVFYYAMQSLV